MQMAGAELNTIATEHGEYCLVSSATQHVIEHAAVFANHADGIATASEQVEHMVVSARSDAHVSADLATDVHLQANAREILMRLRQEIHVEFNNGMWWVMPDDFFRGILSEWKKRSCASLIRLGLGRNLHWILSVQRRGDISQSLHYRVPDHAAAQHGQESHA